MKTFGNLTISALLPNFPTVPPSVSAQNFLVRRDVGGGDVMVAVDDRTVLRGEDLRRCGRRNNEDEHHDRRRDELAFHIVS